MRTTQEIVALFQSRQTSRGLFFEQCRSISQHYNNEIVLPLPEIGEREKPAVANLIATGIDQHAMRIASVLPDIQCPPVKVGVDTSEKRADQRRRSAYGWWEVNGYDLLIKKRARHLVAYSQTPVRIVPSKRLAAGQGSIVGPKWVLKTPLETYPSQMDGQQMQPDDCIFAVKRTVRWLKNAYPDVPLQGLQRPGPSKYTQQPYLTDEDEVEVIEYIDQDQIQVIAVGQGHDPTGLVYEAEYGIQGARIINLTAGNGPRQWAAPLMQSQNRLGMCPVVAPGRISLDSAKGQFDDTTGLFQMQATLMAMEVNAIANHIWPDEWLVGVNGQNPTIVKAADGRKGIVGRVTDGQFVTRQIQPGLQTPGTIDRIERAIRLNGGIPAELGGESASNIRTARRGEALLSSAIDYSIQEHQQILARSAQTELEIAAAIDLTYFRSTKKSFYVSWKGGKGRLDYTPKDTWGEDRTVRVNYAKAGADVNALNVEIGQLKSMNVLSSLTAGRMHPDVKDPEFEHDQLVYEQLEAAQLASLQAAAQQGSLPPNDLARIGQLVRTDTANLFDAVQKAHEEAQARQATPAEPTAPEAQPGLAQPGQGAEQGLPTVPPAGPSVQNLSQLLRAIRTPAQISQAGPVQ